MKIFVTGASGFIGSHLVPKLKDRGLETTVLLRDEKKKKNFESLGANVVIGDITQPKSFQNELKLHETVIHLAAIRSNWGREEDFKKTNSDAIKSLFIPKSKIKHVIITSSVYTMGNLAKIPADENICLNAKDLYGKTKILAEKYTLQYSKKTNIPFTIIRPSIVYGPGDNDIGMISKMIKLITQKKLPIIGTGNNLLHLIYIEDLVNGYIKAIENGGNNQTYILAGANPIKFIDLVNLIKKELKIKYKDRHFNKFLIRLLSAAFEKIYYLLGKIIPPLVKMEPPISVIKVETISNNWYYDITKAKTELGFKPKINYNSGIKKTIEWIKKKQNY